MSNRSISFSYYILFIAIVVLITFAACNVGDKEPEDQYLELTISFGDTLWDIYQSYEDQHNLSFKQFVTWVEDTNNIKDSTIYPGEKLLIPIKHTKEQIKTFASN